MDRDPEGQQVMSLRLSRVMMDIGVTRQMVARRRKTVLEIEKTNCEVNVIQHDNNYTSFIFGSQSEGTSTLGMNSDVDCILCMDDHRVITDWADWEPGKRIFLIIKNEHSPPQHCCLQILKKECPMPETLDMVPAMMGVEKDMDNRVLRRNDWIDILMVHLSGRQIIKQGPSRSTTKHVDMIFALRYSGLLFECNFLFTRPKPGHWPRPEILTKARQCETFLVPQGHAESDQSNLEWRFSTSLIERLLMFDLNILQIQVYTFLKILRKTFFKPLVGDRLSTFHFKTALLFTLETNPPEIWQEHNMMQCAINCLNTLQRWFKHRYCPHYTISGVDLFVGKVRKWEFPLLSAKLSDMIDNIMDFVTKMEMDQIGERFGDRCRTVSTRCQNILNTTMFYFEATIDILFDNYLSFTTGMNDIMTTRNLIIIVRDILYESEIWTELQHIAKWLYQYLASMTASTCLRLNNPIPTYVYRLYKAYLDSDLTSSRLKLASMMYCSGQYERAKLVLAYTEALLHADVWQFNPCSGRSGHTFTERFQQKVYELPALEVIKRHVACSVLFNSFEICCVPKFLVYEMYRTIRPEDFHHRRNLFEEWMDLIVIDSRPFMFYLQYLTYRQLGEEERRLEALQKLSNYVCVESRGCGHIDTALHVLGHCYELENWYFVALACYRKFIEFFPYNNAARWHIMRLLQQL
ncbi:uncharacterized protein LOC128224754 [Mya arenaria]|uniref:uncharacterized protein LOC128224754 n=1 Tax=Mya arenaria TaxID=6604 RepID=UPI0022E0F2C4|nr:uncharacterized protein LOC128224754 [Mya arenaria]XP_052790730.1 uncharacterized protein LOC128224754 [Mya arenaria]XP_052790731.1 uncharacterized protein LOC128224754 [Mya arenaria]XP_052790732.1 uncharacterized protein LOC128224754 [Mya arenaria]